jgi:hypothetical protein
MKHDASFNIRKHLWNENAEKVFLGDAHHFLI